MHRKLDKNAQSLNQLKIWENSCSLISRLLQVARSIDQPRVFLFYLKVKNQIIIKKLLETVFIFNKFVSEFAFVLEAAPTTRNVCDRIEFTSKYGTRRSIFA